MTWRLLVLALLVYGISHTTAHADTARFMLLTQAEFVASPMDMPPRDGWTTVSLPDNWRMTHPTLNGFAWYRAYFRLTSLPAQPLAMYIPHLSLAGEVWLNGSLLNPGVRYDFPSGRMGSQMDDAPFYLILPAGLFRAGENLLDVRLQGEKRLRSGVSAIRIGPPEVLEAFRRPRYVLQITAPYLALTLISVALCFMLVHMSRQRRFYILQAGVLAGLLTLISYFAVDIPFSRIDQLVMRIVISTFMYWILCIAGYRLAGVSNRWFLPILHGVSAATMAITLGGLLLDEMTDRFWLLTWPHIFLRALVIYWILGRAWRERSGKYAMVGMTAALWLATIAQSNLILMEWLGWDAFRWSTAGALPFCFALLFLFAERFILDVEEAALAQRAAVVAERERLLQDMHDGMGGHLITALRLARRDDVDREDLARSIEESLQDLRLIIDSLDLSERDLLPLLGNLRFRLEPRLNALGIALEWDARPPLPDLPTLTPKSALAILRIVQEALNNAIQHANPSALRMTIRPLSESILIQVSDNGPGRKPAAPKRGEGISRGIASMHQRAASIGARLEVKSDDTGTRVSLHLPR